MENQVMPQHNEHRLRFFGAILLTAAISFASGAYVAAELITAHVRQELRRDDRIK